MTTTLDRYRQLQYPGRPYVYTHPWRLAGISALSGGPVPPIEGARILELGCGDGTNLLSLASHLPTISGVGMDGAEGAIAAARAHRDALGLHRIHFEQKDLTQYEPDGQFDYIIAHGVYSWIETDTRDALMALIAKALAPRGLAYVSYNAYPGWHLRNVVRDAMLLMVPDAMSPQAQVTLAQEAISKMTAAVPPGQLHTRVFHTYGQTVSKENTPIVFHDYLAPVNQAVRFSEFAAHCESHGLAWIGEAASAVLRHGELPFELHSRIHATACEIQREVLLDHAHNRDFRRSIIAHSDAKPARSPKLSERLQTLHLALRAPAPERIDIREGIPFEYPTGGHPTTLSTSVEKAIIALLGASFPASRLASDLESMVDELCRSYAQTDWRPEAVYTSLKKLIDWEIIDVLTEPRADMLSGLSTPCTYRLAAYELRLDQPLLTSRLHMALPLDPLDRALLAVCDGRPKDIVLAAAVDVIKHQTPSLLEGVPWDNLEDSLRSRLVRLMEMRLDTLGQLGYLED